MQLDFNNKKAIRSAIGDELAELGKTNSNLVVLDADLSGSTKTSTFAKAFPERFFNVGIAEQNLITTALGLSLTGKIPFVASFAVFVTGRAYDQIRNSVCYQKGNVKIIGAHGGVTVGEDGASHQALEDVALMRELPNMTVICPADYEQARRAVEFASKHNGPVYIRSSRIEVPCIYDDSYKFDINKAIILQEGVDVTILATGDITSEAIKAVQILEENNINAELINIPVIKPLDKDTIINSANKTKFVVTVENHSIIGGLGSAAAECLSENAPHKIVRIGVNDTFGQSGKPNELLKYYELDGQSIADRITKLLK
jgi:transketolase